MWLENLSTRVDALSYVYKAKSSQELVPPWLKDYLGVNVQETGLPRIEHLDGVLDYAYLNCRHFGVTVRVNQT